MLIGLCGCRAGAPPAPLAAGAAGVGAADAGLGLIVEPDRGIAPIDALLAVPIHTLDMTMYELVDPTATSILAADAARGVRVRVVLDANRERSANQAAYGYLRRHGVDVRWAPSSYDATHEKAFVLDGSSRDPTAVVMTLNLTARYYSSTRDFAVVDHDVADARAFESVFDADLAGSASAPTPAGDDLVWSPGATGALESVVCAATTALSVESEEMASVPIEVALEDAALSGVRERMVMTADPRYGIALSGLRAAGVDVRLGTGRDLYIHAKVIVALGARPMAFLGSQNFSPASLDRNRELGIVITDPPIVSQLAAVVAADHADGAAAVGAATSAGDGAATSAP